MLAVHETNVLNALVRTLMTAKFDSDPETFLEYANSPFLAEAFDRAYDALIDAHRRELNEAGARDLESRRDAAMQPLVQQTVKVYLRLAESSWRAMDERTRRSFARTLFRPFDASDDFLTRFFEDFEQ